MKLQFFPFASVLIAFALLYAVNPPFTNAAPDLAETISGIKNQANSDAVPPGPFKANVVVCDQSSHKILILKADADWSKPESVVWEWSPEMSPQIKPEHYGWFQNPDECKPVRGTSHLLVTASGGGVALIRLADKACLFYAHIEGNPHSIELLPDGNVASVSSGGLFTLWPVPEGNDAVNAETRLAPNPRGRQYPIVGGHGMVWDPEIEILWVLGYDELAGYRYDFNKKDPALAKEFSIPVNGTIAELGHDLYPVPNQRAFLVTGVGVGVFDVDKKEFVSLLTPDMERQGKHRVKSMSISPEGFLIVQSPNPNCWWSNKISFFNNQFSALGNLPNGKIYKARWWVEKWK